MSDFQRWNSKASQVDGQMFQFAEETFKKNVRKNLEKQDKKKKTKIKVVCHTANWSYDTCALWNAVKYLGVSLIFCFLSKREVKLLFVLRKRSKVA